MDHLDRYRTVPVEVQKLMQSPKLTTPQLIHIRNVRSPHHSSSSTRRGQLLGQGRSKVFEITIERGRNSEGWFSFLLLYGRETRGYKAVVTI